MPRKNKTFSRSIGRHIRHFLSIRASFRGALCGHCRAKVTFFHENVLRIHVKKIIFGAKWKRKKQLQSLR